MSGRPMEVSVALSVLVSELSEKTWKAELIRFSVLSDLAKVEGNTLNKKIEFGINMD
ncbi:hypothetical protein R3W88_033041 [Solanum pinnatisectum]|uniref:DUF7788 domain-containing protein n=1 Tax=Solanum pinnatisectum TaxID=50273 RepID=A0AAV9K283_9SOLN|nr:hypothetical protein R3W88_033041 [Solanum pinnatisectum]